MTSKKIASTLILVLLMFSPARAINDSLWGIWSAKEQHDTVRLNALRQLVQKYTNTNPDTAEYFTTLAFDYAKKKGLRKYESLSVNDMAFADMTRGNFQKAIDHFRVAAGHFKALDDKKNLAGSIINRAGCFQALGQYDSAFTYFRRGVKYCESFGEQVFRTNALANLGNLYSYLEEYDSALFYFQKVIPLATETENYLALAATYGNIGLTMHKQGNYAAALDYYDKSLITHRKNEHPQGVAYVEKQLGETYHIQKEYKLALQHLENALAMSEKVGDRFLEASVLLSKANLLGDMGRKDESMRLSQQSLVIAEEIGAMSTLLTALVNVGSDYNESGDLLKAQQYYEKALRISKETGNLRMETISLINLGGNFHSRGEPATAMKLVEEGLRLAQESGNIMSIWRAADNLVRIYSDMGYTDKAVDMHVLYAEMQDSINNEENKNAAIRREFKFAYENQALTDSLAYAAETAIREKELQRRKLTARALGSGAILMSIFSVVFFLQRVRIGKEKKHSEDLLHNILPEEVAKELKENGEAEAKLIQNTTVLFTDFKGFTSIAAAMGPKELVADIHVCFSAFDQIMEKYGIEKIKTIGDAYMAAGGLPEEKSSSVKDVIFATFEICAFIEEIKKQKIAAGKPYFDIRVGVHTGPVVAGIVGVKKFQYDIWGDTVNTASRMESNGVAGKVNISQYTYELIKDDPQFSFEYRGMIEAKGKGKVDMWFVSPAV